MSVLGRRPRLVLAALTTGVLALTACDAMGSAPAADLHFGTCTGAANWDAASREAARRRALDVECATLRVPLDHTRTDRGTIGLAVMRVRSSRQHDRIASLVLNPGGPAASGLDAMPFWAAWFPPEILDRIEHQ